MRKSGTTPHLRFKFTLLIILVSLGISLFKLIPYQMDWLQWVILLITFLPAGLLWLTFLKEMELSLSFPLISPILVMISFWDWGLLGIRPSPIVALAGILILSGIILLENPYQDRESPF